MAKSTRKFQLKTEETKVEAKEAETKVESFDPDDVKEMRQQYLDATGKELKLSDDTIGSLIELYKNDADVNWIEVLEAEMRGDTEVSEEHGKQLRADAIKIADALSKNEYLMKLADGLVSKGEDVKLGPLDMYYVIRGMHDAKELDINEMPIPNTTAKDSNRPDRYQTTIAGTTVRSSFYEDLAIRFPRGKAIREDIDEVKKGKEGKLKEQFVNANSEKSVAARYNARWNAYVGLFKTAMRIHFQIEDINQCQHLEVIIDTVKDDNGRELPIRSPKNIVVKDARKALKFAVISWAQLLRYDAKRARDEGDGGLDALEATVKRAPRKPDAKDVKITRENWTGLASQFFTFMSNDDNWAWLRKAVMPGKEGSDDMLTVAYRVKRQFEALVDDQIKRATELDAKLAKAAGDYPSDAKVNGDKKQAA